tara:strand:- start:2174 stop:3259 length:1086 start_codon:yes stop_codon:yes gene_type:complete
MSIKKDKHYINLANNLALNSNGYSGPNPSVGAVVVKNDEIISFGNTSISGRPHAEVNALNKLSKKEKKNSTIYISLEPCSHYGKTPPCVNKLIESQIKRVVYSINDIDNRTSGKAFKILKTKNIKVKKNLLKNFSTKIYKNYFYSKKKRIPYVYGKLAISKDFYIKDKKNLYITNEHSRKATHVIRSKVNCILTTYKTINADNPKLNCRINGLYNSSPHVAILDKNLCIEKKSFVVLNAKKNETYLFYNKQNKKIVNYLKAKKIKMIYTPLYNEELDINFILKNLYKHEISSVLIEGGKSLTYSLLNNDYFNEFYLFISSKYLKNKGILKVSNIKSSLSTKFQNIKFNETFLDKDNLIHYY